jgi:hypothetical protein
MAQMGPLDALWHLLNFLAPPLVVGAIAAALAKLAWWRLLRAAPWWRLAAWAGGAALVASIAALVVFGRDGKMAGYGLMLGACTLALWWAAFRPGRG